MIGVRAKTAEVCTGTLQIIDLCLQRDVFSRHRTKFDISISHHT